MNNSILKVLESIENNGFEAYVIGGYVRDYLLGIESTDVDICTNALPKDLINIFGSSANSNDYGVFKIITDKYNYDITTYRQELKYSGRKPTEILYVDNLLQDIRRRDFTINTICMNSKGEIIDLLNANDDILNKVVKVVGDVNQKLREDPLRILRALRFAIILNFTLDDKLLAGIIENKELINQLSSKRIKDELDKILVSPYAIKGLNLLKNLNILEILGIDYDDVIYVEDICGMYSQLNISKDYPFTKSEKNGIEIIKKILSYGKIDNYILFNYGLYFGIVAGKIMKYDIVYINNLYNDLPIKSYKDLDISTEDICFYLDLIPDKRINLIKKDIKDAILNKKLENDKEKIINYIEINREKWFNEGDNNESIEI